MNEYGDNFRKTEWMDQAECKGEDTRIFFDGSHLREVREMCGRCAVSAACLQYALEGHINEGVYGGFTKNERRSMGRAVRRAARDIRQDDAL